jgi:hypothetical protein
MEQPVERLLTTKEAAEILRISRNKVQHFLPKIRISPHCTRYDPADVRKFIAAMKEKGKAW